MNKRKFAGPLSGQQKTELEQLLDSHPVARTRDRAQAILLSGQGATLAELAVRFGRNRQTVALWLDRWAEQGVAGLLEKPGRGKKKTFTGEEEAKILAWRAEGPGKLKPLLGKVKTHIGKPVCLATVRNVIVRSKAASRQ